MIETGCAGPGRSSVAVSAVGLGRGETGMNGERGRFRFAGRRRFAGKGLFLAAAVGFAFTVTLAGCRDITPDLYDTYEITLFPGEGASVLGQRSVVMKTDGRGRLSELPTPVQGRWTYSCDLPDEWGNPHRYPGVCEHYGCENFVLGTGWKFEAKTDGRHFQGWYTLGNSPVTTSTSFDRSDRISARWLSDAEMGWVARQIAKLKDPNEGLPLIIEIEIPDDEEIYPQVLDFGGLKTQITIKGTKPMVHLYDRPTGNYPDPDNPDDGGEKPLFPPPELPPGGFPPIDAYPREYFTELTLKGLGAMFTVGENVTLILENVRMFGLGRNNSSILVVEPGGKATLKGEVYFTSNISESSSRGGAITVLGDSKSKKIGELTMEDGWIYENYFINTLLGRLDMNTGGGGVWVHGGKFTMKGGKIEKNFAFAGGGGVRISHGGEFILDGGEIFDNKAFEGGGVYVGSGWAHSPSGGGSENSRFTMRNYETVIRDNFAPIAGSGVLVAANGEFKMVGGRIEKNTGNDGVGIFNDTAGITYLYDDAFVWLNDSYTGGTGGITNENRVEMWGGRIVANNGGVGGGVRNFGVFQMFDGHIQSNVGNGGPGGALINVGSFYFRGGDISHNISTVQGGGILNGVTGNKVIGQFVWSGGTIWNNRDLTVHHEKGLPGSGYGNINQRNQTKGTFIVERPGFYSLNPSDPAAGTDWTRSEGDVPVYIGNSKEPTAERRTAYHFSPPAPKDTDTIGVLLTRRTIGRPRIISTGGDNPEYTLRMENYLEAPNYPVEIIDAIEDDNLVFGGTSFPSRLPTAWAKLPGDTDLNGEDLASDEKYRGYAWIVRNGLLYTFDVAKTGKDIPDAPFLEQYGPPRTDKPRLPVEEWPDPTEGALNVFIVPDGDFANPWPWQAPWGITTRNFAPPTSGGFPLMKPPVVTPTPEGPETEEPESEKDENLRLLLTEYKPELDKMRLQIGRPQVTVLDLVNRFRDMLSPEMQERTLTSFRGEDLDTRINRLQQRHQMLNQ